MKADTFKTRYGPWALVAGGSMGLGLAWAEALASRGLSLVMVAELADPLEAEATRLAETHGVETLPFVCDLGQADACDRLQAATAGLDVGLVISNAAISDVRPFLEQRPEDTLRMVDLNCRSPLLLAHTFAPRLVARGQGGLVLTSSIAGRLGTPMVAAYSATKAFDLALGEALWGELSAHGVDVLAWCPGATRTPGWERSRARPGGPLAPPVMAPGPVVEQAIAALGKRPSGVAGFYNRLACWLLTLIGRKQAIRILGHDMRKRYER